MPWRVDLVKLAIFFEKPWMVQYVRSIASTTCMVTNMTKKERIPHFCCLKPERWKGFNSTIRRWWFQIYIYINIYIYIYFFVCFTRNLMGK